MKLSTASYTDMSKTLEKHYKEVLAFTQVQFVSIAWRIYGVFTQHILNFFKITPLFWPNLNCFLDKHREHNLTRVNHIQITTSIEK